MIMNATMGILQHNTSIYQLFVCNSNFVLFSHTKKDPATSQAACNKGSFYLPRVPPVAMASDICDSSSGEGLRAPRVAAMPPATPIMPRALPKRLVPCAERPASAPTQHMPEPKYIIWGRQQTQVSFILVALDYSYSLSLYLSQSIDWCNYL